MKHLPSGKNVQKPSNIQYILFSIFFICIGLVSFGIATLLGIKVARAFRQSPPRRMYQNTIQHIQPWMTLRYVSKSNETPLSTLEAALTLSPGIHTNESIETIARYLDSPVEDVIQMLQKRIQEVRGLRPSQVP